MSLLIALARIGKIGSIARARKMGTAPTLQTEAHASSVDRTASDGGL
jgi:hypothetical protein